MIVGHVKMQRNFSALPSWIDGGGGHDLSISKVLAIALLATNNIIWFI